MANSIDLAQRYLPMLDEIYKRASLTSTLDQRVIQFLDGNAVKIFKTTMQGMGNYDRNNGYVDGDVTGVWETLILSQDRGRSFMVDEMDNEESLDMAFGTLVGEFIRTKVVPEVDAYRFAKYAGTSGILSAAGAALTSGDEVLNAIDIAVAEMDEQEVPMEGRILFITPTNYNLLKRSSAVTRFASMTDTTINTNFEMFDTLRVIKVPQSRFYTGITLYDGKTSGEETGGYAKSADAKDINFLIIHPSAVLQVPKHTLPRIFEPKVNQKADAWKFDYRFYHDAFVLDNKKTGIYLHKGA